MWLDQTAMKLSLRALHPQALKADAPLTKKNPQRSILRAPFSEVVKKRFFYSQAGRKERGGGLCPIGPAGCKPTPKKFKI